MQELENLLNSMIEKWWKPWGIDPENIELFSLDIKRKNIHIWYMDYDNPEEENYEQDFKTFRELVNMESGLWQFVCARELIKYKTSEKIIKRYLKQLITRREWDIIEADVICTDLDPEYRLLESALIPEEELAQFLLDNIKVAWILN